MKKKRIAIYVFIGLILVVAAGGFWIWEKSNNKNKMLEQKQIEIQEQTKSQQENEIDTSNWKTYKNEEYGFEVKYPEDWEYDLIDGVTFGDKKNCERDKIDEYWCESYISFNQYKEEGKYNETVFDWRKYDFKNANVANLDDAVVELKNINNKVIKFDTETANNENYNSYYFIDNDKNGWEITIKHGNKKENQSEINILKEILKTFKLLY